MLKNLELAQFRSYHDRSFTFHEEANLIIGPNGVGKTNLLEAIYVISKTRSFKASDREIVEHKKDWYKLKASLDTEVLEVRYQKNKLPPKQIRIGAKATVPSKYIGSFPSVLFEPSALSILSGGPEGRRRLLDTVLSGIDSNYLTTLLQYRRVIKQRNALLKGRGPIDQIFVWDFKLSELAAILVKARIDFVNFLERELEGLYEDISKQKTKLIISYQTPFQTSEYASELLTGLTNKINQDRLLGSTSLGPHREDIAINFKGQPIASVASRGELRTVLLAIKFLEVKYVESLLNKRPILLLDDVFGELDKGRRLYLLDRIKGYQSIITSTELHNPKQLPPHAIVNL